ncbi:MAG: hypothetical protein ACP5SB_05325 [Caldisericaceae bacterium]
MYRKLQRLRASKNVILLSGSLVTLRLLRPEQVHNIQAASTNLLGIM